MDLSKTALITHRACMDGSACAVLFIALGGNPESVFYSDPGHDNTDKVTQEVMNKWSGPILLVDVGISEHLAEEIDAWLAGSNSFLLLDHHKSSVPLNRFSWCEVDEANTRCGSLVF